MSAFRFIEPCSPVLVKTVPAGDEWLHEIKFDGYRVQAHKRGRDVELYSRRGFAFTERFAPIAIMLRELSARSAVIDGGGFVASDAKGIPDFVALHRRRVDAGDVTFWAFDLLALNGRDLQQRRLVDRQAQLRDLVADLDCPAVVVSEAFDDGEALLRAAEKHGLEGIVSKRRDTPYKSGPCRDWRKVKTTAWREANRERWRLFDPAR